MSPLSPANQIMIAVTHVYQEYGGNPPARTVAAAALRAASDRTENLIIDTFHPKFAEGVLAAGDLLERIAAELDGKFTNH